MRLFYRNRRLLRRLLPAVAVFLAFFPFLSHADPDSGAGARHPEGSVQGTSAVYIIRLDEPPVLETLRERPDAGFPMGEGPVRKRPDFRSPEAMAHLDRVRKRQEAFEFEVGRALARAPGIRHVYRYAFNGLAVALSPEEADAVAALPGVVQVSPESVRFPLTDAGPAWIGASDVWSGSAGAGTRGEGIVVGILDTGIHPGHPSFAEIDGDGYLHANPKGRFFGVCDQESGVYDPDFPCNNKLLGSWSFVDRDMDPASPRDSSGHGTHVAATAAGNALRTDMLNLTQLGVAVSGVAPRANIIAYDVCVTGCPESATLAAIDQAVADGVDVLNLSIGGPARNPWSNPTSLALLAARDSGIFVAVAAGNSGPAQESILSPANAPWVTAVGNATHHRRFTPQELVLSGPGAPPAMNGAGVAPGYGPAPTVYALDLDGDGQCLDPFPAGTWQKGEIVICDRGGVSRVDKGANVKAGGAGGMVLVNQQNVFGLVADFHLLPAVHLSYENGNALKSWLNTGSGEFFGELSGSERVLDSATGDIVLSSSSRGPNSPTPGVLKPDLAAPGVLILASALPVQNQNATFSIMSGTSASAPHAAGAAALLMSLHPEWTPDMVRSALMTTADASGMLNEGVLSPSDPFDRGSGVIDLRDAARAGLALRETTGNFLAADPASGGDPETLNLPFLVDDNCEGVCSWQRALDSTLSTPVAWSVSTSGSPGLTLTVSHSSFTLAPGESVTLLVETDVRSLPENEWAFGEVILSSGSASEVRLPVAVFPGAGAGVGEVPVARGGGGGGGGGGGCFISNLTGR